MQKREQSLLKKESDWRIYRHAIKTATQNQNEQVEPTLTMKIAIGWSSYSMRQKPTNRP